MIENLFLHFKTKDAFTAQLENISEDSIVFIQDSKEVYTHILMDNIIVVL